MDAELALADVTDPTDFGHDDMQALERALRCSVCKDFFDAPVLVPQCGHSFCSVCIRDYLLAKAECPSCRTSTSASALLKNSMLEDAIFAYRAARPFLLSTFTDIDDLRAQNRQLIKEGKRRELQRAATPATEPADGSSERPAKRAKLSPSTPSKSKRKHIVVIEDLEEEEVAMVIDPSDGAESDRNKSGPSSPRKNVKQAPDPNPFVDCPLCEFNLPANEVNAHIETGCKKERPNAKKAAQWSKLFTAGGSTTVASTKATGKKKTNGRAATPAEDDDPQKREPIPKVTWSVTKDKAVRELLEAHGLPLDGDRRKQEKRYDKWIALHNASLDTARARKTLTQLRKELKDWERTTEADVASRSEKKRREKQDRGADKEKEHLEASKDEFSRLVAQARASAKSTSNKPSLPVNSSPTPEQHRTPSSSGIIEIETNA